MVGNAGAAILFVVLLVTVTISGAGILLFAARVFAVIAQQTAGGFDTLEWPKEGWTDWIGRALHLGWLVAFWLVPLGIVLRVVGPESLAASAALNIGVPAGLFCLLFPITLLSSFSADSPWVLVRLEVLGRMARSPGATLGFYLVSAPVCLAGGAALYATLAHRIFWALPALATVVFLYGRLVGRYSRLLGRVGNKSPLSKADREVRRAARAAQVEDPWGGPADEAKKERPRKKKKKRVAKVHDPWAVPEEEEARPEPTRKGDPVETYGLATDKAPKPSQPQKPPAPRWSQPQKPPPVEGYEVNPAEPPAAPKEVPLDGAPPIEARRIPSEPERPLPDHPLLNGVFTFPWYVSNLGVWGLLTLLFLGWGYLYVTMQGSADFMR